MKIVNCDVAHYCYVHPNQCVVYFKVHDTCYGRNGKGGWIGFRINCSVSQDAKHCLRMDGKENKSIRINLESSRMSTHAKCDLWITCLGSFKKLMEMNK